MSDRRGDRVICMKMRCIVALLVGTMSSSCRVTADEKVIEQMNRLLDSEIAFSHAVLNDNVPLSNPELAKVNHAQYLERLQAMKQSDDPISKGQFVLSILERRIQGHTAALALGFGGPDDRKRVEAELTSLRAQHSQLMDFLTRLHSKKTTKAVEHGVHDSLDPRRVSAS